MQNLFFEVHINLLKLVEIIYFQTVNVLFYNVFLALLCLYCTLSLCTLLLRK